MKVKNIMTREPATVTPEASLQEVAKMMLEHNCGCIPVVDDRRTMRPVGVVTDRDIVSRTVAAGRNPFELTAGECMSSPAITITPDVKVADCGQVMQDHQIRRVVVVNDKGACCGIVAQADIATQASKQVTAEMVKAVSQPGEAIPEQVL